MDSTDDVERILNANISLDDWLVLMRDDPRQAPFFGQCFPSDDFEKEFLSRIGQISRADIYQILERFLLQSTTFPQKDESNLRYLQSLLAQKADPVEWLANHPYYTRLMFWFQNPESYPPWEGNTWVLELLPERPKIAIECIQHYLMAHFSYLPDWPINGMFDAMTIIRTKFIGVPGDDREKIDFLLRRDDREFEHVVERLYSKMGYTTTLTPATRDGGKDVIAVRKTLAQKETVAVECKLYNKTIGVELVRAMRGVIAYGGYNKGVIFTTKAFSPDAEKLATTDGMVELVSGDKLVILLNENFGIDWPYYVDRIITESQREHY